MQVMPPDFPEEITFGYLFNKCWQYVKMDWTNILLFSIFYFVLSIICVLIPIVGAILSHIFFFGIVYSMNQFRLESTFEFTDLFWGLKDMNRLKNIFMLTIPFIPMMILVPIFYFYQSHLPELTRFICYILLFTLGTYITLILLLSTFIFVIESETYLKTLIRCHQLLKGNSIDIIVIIAWICFLNIGGLITVIGIVITAPLSALIMLEMCRFLIRQYELKELMN